MSVTIPLGYRSGDWLPATNPCPVCTVAGGVEVHEVLRIKPPGGYSLTGEQTKFTATGSWEFRCSNCDSSGPASPK